ncbi:hypothetical protein Lal_00027152 [Lupinus albus]|nr:hypothetical protein Lal_00027152 [Lupinus albus]
MSEPRKKHVKTMARRQRHMETSGSSYADGGKTVARRDLYYSPNLRATRNFQYKDGVYMTLVQGKYSYTHP